MLQKKILELTYEIDFAKKRIEDIQKEKMEQEQLVLSRKLIKKGGVIKKEEKK